MKGYNNNSKYKKSLNRKVSSDSISSSLMKTTISIFKNKIDHSLLNPNEKFLNSTKKSGKSFFLSEKKNSTQLPKKRYDIKKYNNIIKESNKSKFLKSFYDPNPKYKLYLSNNNFYSTIIQGTLNTRKSENMALFQRQINSRKKRILNNSLSQIIPNSFRRQTAEMHKMPIRNLLLFSTKNKDANNKRNKIFDKQNINIENYQYKRKTNSFNEENQNNNIGKNTEKKINIFNKRSSDNNLLNKIIGNKKLFEINRISLNNDKYEVGKRNSMNDIKRKIRNNIDLKNINKNTINTSLFLKNSINENEIKTTLNKNNIKIISKIKSNNEMQSSTHKNSFISFENIFNNEMKYSSDKNIKNNINNNDNKNNDGNKNKNDNLSNNDNDNKKNDDNKNNDENKGNNINNDDNKNNNDNNNINDDEVRNKNNYISNKNNDDNNNDNNINNNDNNINNYDNKNNNDNNINNYDNLNNNDNLKNNDKINNNADINIESKRNSIYSSINSIKKNEITPESKRNSIFSIIHSIKKNEIIGESKINNKEMIDNNDKNLMNNIINRNKNDSMNDINKNQNTPISDINIINEEKDNKINIKKNENNIIFDNNKDEENKKSNNKIISFNNKNNDKEKEKEKEKEKGLAKKKVYFSTKHLLQFKNEKDKKKENKENNRVASLKNINLNKSATNLFSFESDSQNISNLSKEEEIKYDMKSFKTKSKKMTINLTKKLLVENTKVKLKIINRYIKNNRSSLLIQNKFDNLKYKNYKFLNKIYNNIDQSIINKNNRHILNEKAKILKINLDNFNSLLNEFKNNMKYIYDIDITEELEEIYDKNNDQNSFKIYSDLILPCNINNNLSIYIFRNIEFKGVFRNKFIEDQRSNKYEIIKKKSSRKSVLHFPSIKNNQLFISKLERFLVDKTNLIRKDEDSNWKKEKYNFMMVHKFKVKSLFWAKNENALINNKNNNQKFEIYQRNDYKSRLRNTLHVSKRKIIGIQRISVTSSINTKNINRSLLKKKTISLFKRPSLDLRSSVKKKRKKNFNKISILINKTFFNRKNDPNLNYAKKKSSIFAFEDIQNEDNKNNEDINSNNILEHPKNIDDVYFGLTLLIANGKEYQFMKYFNKYEKILDIDFPIYEGNTLLMMSTKEGNAGITRFLCEKKADVNLKNDRGNTALHYAIGQKFYKIVDILTIFGAREDILNNKGQSPWDC